MGGKKAKKTDAGKNRRLDAFLTQLEIENEKKDKILRYVQDLTYETLQRKSAPRLRLKR